jgi:tetraacyldisaccharide 4'-kinase
VHHTQLAERLPVPVIVVGNISIGGTGKTPVIQALASHLMQRGYRPGIISRGHGARQQTFPARVPASANPQQYGDEPALLAHSTSCPVVIDPDRVRAAHYLLETTDCNLILSDDGLQHYRLARDIEIIVLDGERGLGNGHCLPAGPLREPAARLAEGALLLCNGCENDAVPTASVMQLASRQWRHLQSGRTQAVTKALPFSKVHAVAGIGNPQRFFNTLESLDLTIESHAFPDHHAFTPDELAFNDELPIVMTSKDAIKCQAWANPRIWVLDVQAQLPDDFIEALIHRLPGDTA